MSRIFSASPGVTSGSSAYFQAVTSAVSAIRFINKKCGKLRHRLRWQRQGQKIQSGKMLQQSTIISLFGAVLHRWKKEVQSAMFHATTKSTAANVVIGIREASGIKTTKIMLKVIQCVIPAIGVRPPFLTFAAVRAIAPVAGIPPNRPEKYFQVPDRSVRHLTCGCHRSYHQIRLRKAGIQYRLKSRS